MDGVHKIFNYSSSAECPDWFTWSYLSWDGVQCIILLLWWTVIREQFLSDLPSFSNHTNLSGEKDLQSSNFLQLTMDPQPTNSKLGVRLIRAAWLADAKIHINFPTFIIESYRYVVRCMSKPDAAPTPNNESIKANVLAAVVCELDMSKKTSIGKETSTVPLKQGHSDIAVWEESHHCLSSSSLAHCLHRCARVLTLYFFH